MSWIVLQYLRNARQGIYLLGTCYRSDNSIIQTSLIKIFYQYFLLPFLFFFSHFPPLTSTYKLQILKGKKRRYIRKGQKRFKNVRILEKKYVFFYSKRGFQFTRMFGTRTPMGLLFLIGDFQKLHPQPSSFERSVIAWQQRAKMPVPSFSLFSQDRPDVS